MMRSRLNTILRLSAIPMLIAASHALGSDAGGPKEAGPLPGGLLWSATAETAGVAWQTPGGRHRRTGRDGEEVRIPTGGSATLVLDATRSSWQDHGILEIDLTAEMEGLVPVLLRERDEDGIECWVAPVAVREGRQVLRVVLDSAPAGDLRPALPQQDGVFNPAGEGPMDLVFSAYAGGVQVRSLNLRSQGRVTPEDGR